MTDVRFEITGIDRLKYDKAELKRAIRIGGAVVRQEARRLIARRAISGAGEFPGKDSGAMMRSIKVKTGSGGGYAKVMPYKTSEMGKDFYPAFLFYGTSRGLKPRKNFMTAALDNKQSEIRATIRRSLAHAVVAK